MGAGFSMKGLFGGPDRDRTDDLFHAMEARSQLRHRPTLWEDNEVYLLRRDYPASSSTLQHGVLGGVQEHGPRGCIGGQSSSLCCYGQRPACSPRSASPESGHEARGPGEEQHPGLRFRRHSRGLLRDVYGVVPRRPGGRTISVEGVSAGNKGEGQQVVRTEDRARYGVGLIRDKGQNVRSIEREVAQLRLRWPGDARRQGTDIESEVWVVRALCNEHSTERIAANPVHGTGKAGAADIGGAL